MAHPTEHSSFMSIPIELRHIIYGYASVGEVEPKKAFRRWFEKMDVKAQIAQRKAEDPLNNPVAVYGGPYDYEDDTSAGEDESSGQDENEDNSSTTNGEDEDENTDEGENADEGQENEGNEAEDEVDEPEADSEDPDETQNGKQVAFGAGVGVHAQASVTDQDMDSNDSADLQIVSDALTAEAPSTDNNDAATTDAEHTSEDDENAMEVHDSDVGSELGDVEHHSYAASAAQFTFEVRPASKWRHVSKSLRITHNPPPVELLLINKQISREAKDWFYKVAKLKIDATASFAHQTFFEETLEEIAHVVFSPMEHFRKAELTFVWDTTWIRNEASGYAGSVFPFMLYERAEYVLRILQKAPELEQVFIHWHDSAQDDGAIEVQLQILELFITGLKAKVDWDAHFISVDVEPKARTLAGKRRQEFQDMIDGLHVAF